MPRVTFACIYLFELIGGPWAPPQPPWLWCHHFQATRLCRLGISPKPNRAPIPKRGFCGFLTPFSKGGEKGIHPMIYLCLSLSAVDSLINREQNSATCNTFYKCPSHILRNAVRPNICLYLKIPSRLNHINYGSYIVATHKAQRHRLVLHAQEKQRWTGSKHHSDCHATSSVQATCSWLDHFRQITCPLWGYPYPTVTS